MLQQSFNPDKLWRKILIIMIFISLAFILTFCTKKTTSIDEQLLAPSNLQISLIENNKIQISWTDNSTNETKFLIARKVGTFNWQDIFDEVEANITSFSNIIPTNSDTIYSYKVRAFDGSDYSEYSDIVAWFSVNSAPTNLQLEQIDQDSIKLTWQDNSVGELNFRIDRKIGDADWQENYKILEQDTISYIDHGNNNKMFVLMKVFIFFFVYLLYHCNLCTIFILNIHVSKQTPQLKKGRNLTGQAKEHENNTPLILLTRIFPLLRGVDTDGICRQGVCYPSAIFR